MLYIKLQNINILSGSHAVHQKRDYLQKFFFFQTTTTVNIYICTRNIMYELNLINHIINKCVYESADIISTSIKVFILKLNNKIK